MLEERIRIIALFDIYGALLTERQQKSLTLYFFEDFSMAEIGDALGISRQAVNDTLRRSKELLEEYEKILGLYTRTKDQRALIDYIYNEVNALETPDKVRKKVILDKLAILSGREDVK